LLAAKTSGSIEDAFDADEDFKVNNMPHVCCVYVPNVQENEGIVEAIFTLPTNINPITPKNISVDITGLLLTISFTWDEQFCNAFTRYREILEWEIKDVASQSLTKAFIGSSKSGTAELRLPCRVSSEIRKFIRFEDTIFGVQLVSLENQAKKRACVLEVVERKA
jgi:hypothetical protein